MFNIIVLLQDVIVIDNCFFEVKDVMLGFEVCLVNVVIIFDIELVKLVNLVGWSWVYDEGEKLVVIDLVGQYIKVFYVVLLMVVCK